MDVSFVMQLTRQHIVSVGVLLVQTQGKTYVVAPSVFN